MTSISFEWLVHNWDLPTYTPVVIYLTVPDYASRVLSFSIAATAHSACWRCMSSDEVLDLIVQGTKCGNRTVSQACCLR